MDIYIFLVNASMPSVSQMEAKERRDLTKVGITCDILDLDGRVGKSKTLSWIVEIVVLSGRMNVGPIVVGFTSRSRDSVLR